MGAFDLLLTIYEGAYYLSHSDCIAAGWHVSDLNLATGISPQNIKTLHFNISAHAAKRLCAFEADAGKAGLSFAPPTGMYPRET